VRRVIVVRMIHCVRSLTDQMIQGLYQCNWRTDASFASLLPNLLGLYIESNLNHMIIGEGLYFRIRYEVCGFTGRVFVATV
jgi:hypothetical protein